MMAQRATRVVAAVNVAGAAAATVFAALGAARPGYVGGDADRSELSRFWAASSGVRTIAIAGPLLMSFSDPGGASSELLAVAGLVQVGDSALGVWQRNPRMAVAPALMGAIHLASAYAARSRSSVTQN